MIEVCKAVTNQLTHFVLNQKGGWKTKYVKSEVQIVNWNKVIQAEVYFSAGTFFIYISTKIPDTTEGSIEVLTYTMTKEVI